MTQTPESTLKLLKKGNERFQNNFRTNRDLLQEVHDTQSQTPVASILHCIDSRVSAELIFDLGVGDAFSARVAGNIVNSDLLGSLEFANSMSTSRVIVIMGHTSCGAVQGAINDGRPGNLKGLLDKIAEAIEPTKLPEENSERIPGNPEFVNNVAATNVRLTYANLLDGSPLLRDLSQRDMDDDSRIRIVGAMYDISDGKVYFNEWNGIKLYPDNIEAVV